VAADEAEVRSVAVPADGDRRVLWVLDKQFGGPDEQVGTDEVFDTIEDGRVRGQFECSGPVEVHLAHFDGPRSAAEALF
jgi:hypothetical protein